MIHTGDILTTALEDAYAAWEAACDAVDREALGTAAWWTASRVADAAHANLYDLELAAASQEGVIL